MNHSDSHRPTLAPEAIDSFPPSQDLCRLGHADSLSLDAPNSETRFFVLRQPIFFSLLVHSLIFLALLLEFDPPNRRPIKEASAWVVNLVSEWNVEPKGLKHGNIEGATLALPGQGEKSDRVLTLPAEMTSIDRRASEADPLVQPQEISSAASQPGEDQPPQPPLAKMEDRLRVMRDAVDQQIQMGQYLFTMKAQDQMMGIKIRYFQKNARISLEGILKASIPEEERLHLKGKSAAVRVTFPIDGQGPAISVAPESDPSLAAILEHKIDWRNMASPSTYALPHKAMNLRLAVNDTGSITVRVELL